MSWKVRTVLCAGVVALLMSGNPAAAQTADDPNPGALTFTGSFDVPSIYFFRGIRQETDPGFTMFPAADLGIALGSSDGAIKSVGVNFGLWNSLQTGSSGTDGPTEQLHYEEDFYATLGLGFAQGFSLGTTFTAYTSPNGIFGTVKELSFKVAKSHMLNPYGIIAFELGGDDSPAADGGDPGTYLELGVGPGFPLADTKATLTVPVKFGFSLSDYYQDPITGEDNKFGYFDLGGLVTLPLSGIPSQFGSWNVHGGLDWLLLGDTPKFFNADEDGDTGSNRVIWSFGIGVSY
jgi:hypothetical protein